MLHAMVGSFLALLERIVTPPPPSAGWSAKSFAFSASGFTRVRMPWMLRQCPPVHRFSRSIAQCNQSGIRSGLCSILASCASYVFEMS
jgi:hypothetical protein